MQNLRLLCVIVHFFLIDFCFGQTDSLKFVFTGAPNLSASMYSITGTITDSESKGITRVSLYVNGQFSGTNTDDNGRYFIELPPGDYRIVFRHISMLPKTCIVTLRNSGLIDLQLEEKRFNLDEVIIQADGTNQHVAKTIAGVVHMGIKELKAIPAFMGEADIIKGLQLMPGVTSVGEGSSGINVRGGQTDQNLILMNDVVVLGTNHALGFLSSFNPDVVQSFNLYKGNIPSYYGGRTSSALAIDMQNGNLDEWKFQGALGTSLFKVLIDGPLVEKKASIITGLRLSNANWLLQKVKDENVKNSKLNFLDIYSSVMVSLSPKTQLKVNTLLTGDSFRFSNEFGYDWRTSVTSLSIKSLISKNLSIYGLTAYGNFANEYSDPSGPESATISNGIKYIQGKASALFTTETNSLTVGSEVINYSSNPENISPFDVNSGVRSKSVQKEKGIEVAGFISDEWTPTPFLGISAGLRYSFYTQLGPDSVFLYAPGESKSVRSIQDTLLLNGAIKTYSGFEPRVSFRINVSQAQSLKLSYSRLIQYIQSISNTTAPTPIDLWQVSTLYIKPQISNNFSIGYFLNFNDNAWSTSVEAFYRKTKNQLDYKDFAKLLLNSHLETELVSGNGISYGTEFLIRRNKGKWTGWLSYTFSRSLIQIKSQYPEDQINGGSYYTSNFDKPHTASLLLNRKLWPRNTFTISFTYATGRPISAVSSTYTVNGVTIPNYSERNEYRIPDYLRMDVSFTAGSIFKKVDDNLSISVYNVLARRNAYSVFFKPDGTSQILKPFRLSVLGTLFPSITYTVTF